MRSYPLDFELVAARGLADAVELVGRGLQPFAGGTDLMVLFNAGKLRPGAFVAVSKLNELRRIQSSADFLEIGAATTYSEIRGHAEICESFPLLAQAAGWTGGIANQNRGTLGGNVANASPAADSAPPLLAYDAEVKLVSAHGERWLPYSEFHLGYKSMAMKKGELIAAFRLPKRAAFQTHYGRKVGTRRAMAISKVSLAATVHNGAIRIAAGSVAPMPIRCKQTEEFVMRQRITPAAIQEAKKIVLQDISPIADIRSSREYRLKVTQNLLGDFLEMLL